MFLTLGVWLGIPWLVNPVLGALTVVLTHGVVRRLYSDRVAGWVTLLMGASPWFLFMNMNLMTHSLTLLAAVLAAYGTARWVAGGRLGWTLLAGLGLGVVALNRPLEGLIAAAVCGLWALGSGPGTVAKRGFGTTVMALSSAAVVALTLPYNQMFTGHGTRFPIMAYTDTLYGPGSNAMGFGASRGLGWRGLDPFPGHGWLDGAINTALNSALVNTELLGWATGSIVVLFLLLLLPKYAPPGAPGSSTSRVIGHPTTTDWAVAAAAGIVVVTHVFYWFSGGPDFGARYWYLAVLPLLILAGRSLVVLGERVAAPGRVGLGACILVLSTLVVSVPWRAVDKYRNYRGMRPDIRVLAAEQEWGPDDVILIQGDRDPDYASAATYNPLDLRGPGPLYAWDRDDHTRAAVVQAYPGRRFWTVLGPTRTGAGFELVGRWEPGVETDGTTSAEGQSGP